MTALAFTTRFLALVVGVRLVLRPSVDPSPLVGGVAMSLRGSLVFFDGLLSEGFHA
jgi:hypothetical protein